MVMRGDEVDDVIADSMRMSERGGKELQVGLK